MSEAARFQMPAYWRKEWLHLQTSSPCFWKEIFMLLNLLFLGSFMAQFLLKTIQRFCISELQNLEEGAQKCLSAKAASGSIKLGKSYRASRWCCSLMLACSILELLLLLLERSESQCEFSLLVLCKSVKVLSLLVLLVAILSFQKAATIDLPWAFRLWCCIIFFQSATSLAFNIGFIVLNKLIIRPEEFVEVIGLLAGLFLIAISIMGKTGISSTSSSTTEPLLYGSADLKQAESVRNCPYGRATITQLVTFSWLNPLLSVGIKKPLEQHEVPEIDVKDSAEMLSRLFDECLERVKENNGLKSSSIYRAMFLFVRRKALINACFAVVSASASYVGPSLINDFVNFLGGKGDHRLRSGYLLALTFLSAKFVEAVAQRQWIFGARQLGLRLRAALISHIYQKGLHLSNQSRQSHTSGEIINYMSVDIQRITDIMWYSNIVWMLPIQISLAIYVLHKNLGIGAMAGLAATFMIMACNIPITRTQKRFQSKIMECKDERMKATTEVLKNMKVLKLQAWDTQYLRKLEALRKTECDWLWKSLKLQSVSAFVFWGAPGFISIVTFGICILIGIPLTAGRVLSAMATFRMLQDPIFNLPDLLSALAQAKVSADRVASYLQEDEIKSDATQEIPKDQADFEVDIEQGTFSWGLESESPTLCGIELKVRRGMKVAICGTVGSGKSSLLSSILGEIPKMGGSVKISGRKAYVPQTPWILTGNIRENILFGSHYDQSKYETTIKACALTKDFELFADGDLTEIGERGINMSGGQKQRIQIARAVYQDADIYLLDDPFSALDAHTGNQLFKDCLMGILKDKTIIYVTHQVEFLPAADIILVMHNGKIAQAGKFAELLHQNVGFELLVGAHNQALESIFNAEYASRSLQTEESRVTSRLANDECDLENSKDAQLQSIEKQESAQDLSRDVAERGRLTQDEEREKGSIGKEVYWSYLTAVRRGALVPVVIIAQSLFQILQVASNYWMAWAAPPTKDSPEKIGISLLFFVYIALSAGSALCVFVRALLVAIAGLLTSQKLFKDMLHCVLRAPMLFFDSTPTGRILNRQYYIPTARELARLSGIQRAPILHHFAESLAGAATIRAFGQKDRFANANLSLIDNHSKPWFHNVSAMEWLSFRLNMLSNFVFAFSLVLLVSLPEGFINPSIAGLAVTYGLNLNSQLATIIWNICNAENKMISVERILQYSRIPSEAPLIIEDNRPPQNWPENGIICFQNLQVRYAEHLPSVLKDITCTITGRKKVGVVGRTGSGKSTLIQALFRIVEPREGHIIIDGVDICKIGLHDLRSRLSIIPQDPTLFEGTVLDKCQLGELIRGNEKKMDSTVVENGENWSVGQRQLFCLGRALLKRSSILVLDEATASVDSATDGIIQETIRQEFNDCTVVTIAHRIHTVIDSDLILVLSDEEKRETVRSRSRSRGKRASESKERERGRERAVLMPKSSSPSPTITPMNPMKTYPQTLTLTPTPTAFSALAVTSHAIGSGGGDAGEPAAGEDADDLFHPFHIHHQSLLIDDDDEEDHEDPLPNPNDPNASSATNTIQTLSQHHSPFSSLLFRDPDEDDEEDEDEEPLGPSSAGAGGDDVADEAEGEQQPDLKSSSGSRVEIPVAGELPQVDPLPHISSQFYTFNCESHSLMVRCILEGRLATPTEIRHATPKEVLKSWRSVWKDRNEDTAYLTAWKRIQDKLHADGDTHGKISLYFKNNPSQRVSHFEQWQEIVASCHGDSDRLRHLGLKETVDRIKHSWTVGAKFYGIPESFIRVCISSCPVCHSTSLATGSGFGNAASRTKRRRFEYTESFDLPARDVPRRLQQLATKHKVVLCIRQKYIRYKPFMAEVKDYACHRAGAPSSSTSSLAKKQKVLKREPYQSKRCGCGFRIRAIVPIANYNEKDKTFVYQEEGTAVFKLYAVHSGHEPGPLDGSARIIHRVLGQKGGFDFDPDVYGIREDLEPESFIDPMVVKDDELSHCHSVFQKIQELRMAAGLLEGTISKMSPEMLHSISCLLTDILMKLKSFIGQQVSEDCLVRDEEVHLWGNERNQYSNEHIRVFGDKDGEIMEEDEADFGSSLGNIVPWDTMAAECQDRKMLRESCKTDKWLLKENSGEFDEKSILNCSEEEDSKFMKPLRPDDSVVADPNIVGFYPDNSKWYDSPGCLDTGTESVDGGFRHGVDIDGIREPVSGSLLYGNNIISGAIIPTSAAIAIDNAVCATATLVMVDSARKDGILLEAVQVLTDLDLSISERPTSPPTASGSWTSSTSPIGMVRR
ncbi:ABC transporter C family member 9 [Apostasia shenzhenica]|uniref:ABC transporter C family member 9 n=1 Tax=Apostasia shenzhenica TaxID=1088818 RepID=A0A2I0ALC1_9ASPA|nr:ABC transporter C family member 9 [Apostasia shenzhenica]